MQIIKSTPPDEQGLPFATGKLQDGSALLGHSSWEKKAACYIFDPGGLGVCKSQECVQKQTSASGVDMGSYDSSYQLTSVQNRCCWPEPVQGSSVLKSDTSGNDLLHVDSPASAVCFNSFAGKIRSRAEAQQSLAFLRAKWSSAWSSSNPCGFLKMHGSGCVLYGSIVGSPWTLALTVPVLL